MSDHVDSPQRPSQAGRPPGGISPSGAEVEHPGGARRVDPTVGLLTGEASEQRVPAEREGQGAPPYGVWGRPLPREERPPADTTYYERPLLKEPVWSAAVPLYFYVGGLTGAATVLGAVALRLDRPRLDGLIARCRWIGTVGAALSGGLLIVDLGRPERFLNMLRVFRPTSPMNIGTWLLTGTGMFAGPSAVLAGSRSRPLGAVGDVAAHTSALFGMPLAGYTAVLLSQTAVPVWQEARRSLPLLFIGSAMSSAASVLQLTPLTPREQDVARRFGMVGQITTLTAMLVMEREVARVDRVAAPLRRGPAAMVWQASRAAEVVSLLLAAVSGRSRPKAVSAAVLGTAAAIALRFAVFFMGRQSARDPRAAFHQQRAGRGAEEVTGISGVAGPDRRRAHVPQPGERDLQPPSVRVSSAAAGDGVSSSTSHA
jgi:formate-dependent nitrite reductase membrane component NrfD